MLGSVWTQRCPLSKRARTCQLPTAVPLARRRPSRSPHSSKTIQQQQHATHRAPSAAALHGGGRRRRRGRGGALLAGTLAAAALAAAALRAGRAAAHGGVWAGLAGAAGGSAHPVPAGTDHAAGGRCGRGRAAGAAAAWPDGGGRGVRPSVHAPGPRCAGSTQRSGAGTAYRRERACRRVATLQLSTADSRGTKPRLPHPPPNQPPPTARRC